MSLFITDAYAAAQPAAAHPPSIMSTVIFIVVFFAIFYFLFIRPQQKKQKELRNMLDNLGKGDEIITNGGVMGKINKITDHFIVLEIADNIEIKIQKNAVSAVLPKGTIKES